MSKVDLLAESKKQLEESVATLLDINSKLCSDYLDKNISTFLKALAEIVNSSDSPSLTVLLPMGLSVGG